MSRPKKAIVGVIVIYIIASIAVGIALSEYTLHVHRRPINGRAKFASIIHEQFQAELQDVSVSGRDGAVLRGWYAQPQEDNGATVILLHGVTDNREGVAAIRGCF